MVKIQNTLKNRSNIVFNYAFLALFFFISIAAAVGIIKIRKDYFAVFVAALEIFILFCIGKYINGKTPSDKQVNITFLILLAMMIVLQIIAGYSLICNKIHDWRVIDTLAQNFAETGTFENMYRGLPEKYNGYMARYTNNNGTLIMLSLYDRLVFLVFGYVPLYAPVALNTLCLTIAVVFTFLTAKKILSPMGALITSVFCFIFLPYYTYTAYYYSDSLSIPFVTIAVYFIISGAKPTSNKLFKRIVCLVIAAVSISVGYSIKGSILVVLVAAIVYIALENKLKQAIAGILCIVLAFGITSVGIKACFNSMQFTTEEELYEKQYPLNHWIMMGLHGNGGYYAEDYDYTLNAGNYDEKKAADNKLIAERLKEMGVGGMLYHLAKKLSYTWSDGTYNISYFLNIFENDGETLKTEYNPLFEIVISKGKYFKVSKVYGDSIQIIMLIFMLLSAYFGIRQKKVTPMTFIRGIVFGAALFLMIWESCTRYLFNFTPLFILLASEGIEIFMSRAQPLLNRHIKKQPAG